MLSDPRDRGGPAQPLLLVEGLRKHFPVRGGLLNRQVATVQAVDDVSFSVRKGETLGIVGESGCGKSTTARLLMRLIEPDAGAVVFDGDRRRRSSRHHGERHAPADADGVPGQLFLAEPAHDHGGEHRLRAPHARPSRQGRRPSAPTTCWRRSGSTRGNTRGAIRTNCPAVSASG